MPKGIYIRTEKNSQAARIVAIRRYESGNHFGFQKGHVGYKSRLGEKLSEETKEKIRNSHLKEGAYNWQGTDTSYTNLHLWVRRNLGNPKECSRCGLKGGKYQNTRVWNIDWASKSREYKRDLTDWIGLCKPCHRKYDKKEKVRT